MKVSELISNLESVLKDEGDISICLYGDGGEVKDVAGVLTFTPDIDESVSVPHAVICDDDTMDTLS